jgi:ubiquinone/menaquinone biosynthesis C-methylase UbiE
MERTLEPEVMDDVAEADAYDAMDFGEPNRAVVERLAELGARGRMLDIGTGPGHILLLVAERFPDAQVVGLDLSPRMLEHAARRRAGSPHAARIALQLGDAKRLPFPDASFDVVFSNTILHHVPEPVAMLAEARRVLRPGGALLIRDLFRPPTPARALELTAQHAAGMDATQKELFRASLHAALEPGELAACARASGLDGAEVVIDSDRHMTLQRRAKG